MYGNELFSNPTLLCSQNLVPNHSFEEVENLPLRGPKRNGYEFEFKSGYLSFQSNLKFWKWKILLARVRARLRKL